MEKVDERTGAVRKSPFNPCVLTGVKNCQYEKMLDDSNVSLRKSAESLEEAGDLLVKCRTIILEQNEIIRSLTGCDEAEANA